MRFIRYWLPFLAFACAIFFLSSIPGNGFPPMPIQGWHLPAWIAENPDKIVHAALYAVFGWLCLRALARGSAVPFPKAAIWAVLIGSAYGATDEWHQYFVPLRSCTWSDWIADTLGASFAVLIFYRTYAKA